MLNRKMLLGLAIVSGVAAGTVARGETPKYSVKYGVPKESEVREVVERVFGRIDQAHTARVMDRRTRETVSDLSKPVGNLGFDSGEERKFNPNSYPMGVIHSGMINCAEVMGDGRYAAYTGKWLEVIGKAVAACEGWPKEKGVGGVENPVGNLLRPENLDSSGAMATAMIRAEMAKVEVGNGREGLKLVVDRALSFVMEKQYRLGDGTLGRPRGKTGSVWADDMYMGGALLVAAGRMPGGEKYLDEAAKQVLLMSRHLFVPEVGLMTHGVNDGAEGYHPRYFWGRANGWCMVTMAELLTAMPEGHPQREAVLKQFRLLAQGVQTQQGGNGFWHQMLNRPDSYEETSATAMFVFAFARGVEKGWLNPPTFGPAAVTGWNAVASRVDIKGRVTGTCVGTNYGADYAYYYHRPAEDDVHGYGPVLLAGSEVVRMLRSERYRAGVANSDSNMTFTVKP